jgi:hypothetical protein
MENPIMAKAAQKYGIEDRRKHKPAAMGAGKFIVWELVTYPIPCRLYRGMFATRKEAKAYIASQPR